MNGSYIQYDYTLIESINRPCGRRVIGTVKVMQLSTLNNFFKLSETHLISDKKFNFTV